MFARVTLLEIDVVRADVDDVLDRYRQDVLPEITSQPGYEGMFVLVNPEGQGLIMSLWSDESSLESTMPLASGAVERFLTVFREAPGRESYEVRLADLPSVGVE
jgi:hypothetical protein